jgi:AraC-like DNA-binding protein
VTAFFITIILLGALQGIIVSGMLFFTNRNRLANRLLSGLIFLIAMASFNLYLNYKDWFHNPWFRLIGGEILPLVVVMPAGPLIYFYLRSSLDPSFKMTRRQKRHFWPVIIDLVPNMAAIIYIVGILLHLIGKNPGPWGIFIDTYNVYADIPRWMSLTYYVWLANKYLAAVKANNNGRNGISDSNIRWLQQFIWVFLAFQAIWFIYLVPYVIPQFTDFMLNTFDWYPVYLPLAVMIYWLGIKGFIVNFEAGLAAKKATGNGLSLAADVIEKVTGLLQKSMEEEKLFLNPNCNLSLLAQQTNLAPKTISAVLNQHLNKSFNEYVNEYRVAEFKKKVLQPGHDHLTITGIAFECGFNSQATFQRTFKEFTGMSPSEFRKMSPASGE